MRPTAADARTAETAEIAADAADAAVDDVMEEVEVAGATEDMAAATEAEAENTSHRAPRICTDQTRGAQQTPPVSFCRPKENFDHRGHRGALRKLLL